MCKKCCLAEREYLYSVGHPKLIWFFGLFSLISLGFGIWGLLVIHYSGEAASEASFLETYSKLVDKNLMNSIEESSIDTSLLSTRYITLPNIGHSNEALSSPSSSLMEVSASESSNCDRITIFLTLFAVAALAMAFFKFIITLLLNTDMDNTGYSTSMLFSILFYIFILFSQAVISTLGLTWVIFDGEGCPSFESISIYVYSACSFVGLQLLVTPFLLWHWGLCDDVVGNAIELVRGMKKNKAIRKDVNNDTERQPLFSGAFAID